MNNWYDINIGHSRNNSLDRQIKISEKAFTLAEVLITLAVIGIIASMTIPSLVQSIQDNNYKTAYKKAYASATVAWKSALADNQIASITDWVDTVNNCANFNAFKSKFVVLHDCGTTTADCWATGDILFNGFGPVSGSPAFIDNSGMSWAHYGCGAGGQILVDTNGFAGPNQFGKDKFAFKPVLQDGSIAAGLQVRLIPSPDYTDSTTLNVCKNYPCYNTSWLTQ